MFHSKPTFKPVAVPTVNPRSIRFDGGALVGGDRTELPYQGGTQ